VVGVPGEDGTGRAHGTSAPERAAEPWQVVVVGAGPAGATAARCAARAGAEVLLIDRRAVVGRPVECAGFLPAQDELAAMLPGVPDQQDIFGVPERFVLDRTEETVIVSPSGRRKVLAFQGVTIDRAAWDAHNVDLAVEAGAEFRPSTGATGYENGTLVTEMGVCSPTVLIAADGPRSRMRRCAGLPDPRLIAPALNADARIKHEGRVEMHFCREAAGGYAWVIPAGDGRAHVGLGADPRRGGGDLRPALERFARRVGAELGAVSAGAVPSAGPVARTVAGNVMLAGDAAGHVMASNGGGVPIALAAGRAAGEVAAAVADGKARVEDYERRWRAEVGEVLEVAARIRWLAGVPFRWPLLLDMVMWAMPRWEMARALRCQRMLFVL
jgi:digeranylgeranylglycerophospholipid reductase